MMIMINTNHDNEEIDDDDADSAKIQIVMMFVVQLSCSAVLLNCPTHRRTVIFSIAFSSL